MSARTGDPRKTLVPKTIMAESTNEVFIVCLYKGKGDALDRGNYRGLKLTEQAMKILERIVDGLIRQVVSIDDSQFGFVPGRGTTDAIPSSEQEALYGLRGPRESI